MMKKYKKQLLMTLGIFLLPSLIFQITLPMLGIGRTYYIPADAMKPTIVKGDRVFVETISWDFKINDIVAYEQPPKRGLALNQKHLKRIAAMQGDILSSENLQLLINGRQVCDLSTYSGHRHISHWILKLKDGDYVIPKDMYFILGDNIDMSLDSRTYGLVEKKNIIGKYFFNMGFLSMLIFHW